MRIEPNVTIYQSRSKRVLCVKVAGVAMAGPVDVSVSREDQEDYVTIKIPARFVLFEGSTTA
jgi:hypothetical protein